MKLREPVRYPTVAHMFARMSYAYGDKDALVMDDRTLCYGEYAAAVRCLAAEFADIDVAGKRIATVLGNGFDTCIASYAAWFAGAQLVPLNPHYTARELAEILDDAAPTVLIYDTDADPASVAYLDNAKVNHRIRTGAAGRDLSRYGVAATPPPPLPFPQSDSLALLQYTGGTTGRAKGVDLTHHAIAYNVYQRESALPTQLACERILCAMPLFHAYGFSMGLLLAVDCAGALVVRRRYHPEDVLNHFGAERITIFPGAPTIYNGLVTHEEFTKANYATLHTCYSGSAPLAVETLSRWTEVTGAPIYEGYGQTEAGPVLSFNKVGRPIKPGTVGEPLVDTDIQIVDTGTGARINKPDVTGEIRARGPQLMRGYRGLKKESLRALRDGWLYTGDLGAFDADGYLRIFDRLKDMAIVGGYNVYPREVDEVLFSHPAILDAAAVGVPDAYRGEVIRAFVVLTEEAAADTQAVATLHAHCRENLARYKCPVSIDVLPTLPKTSVNKTDKSRLREHVAVQQVTK